MSASSCPIAQIFYCISINLGFAAKQGLTATDKELKFIENSTVENDVRFVLDLQVAFARP
jgi:hypothetical protein